MDETLILCLVRMVYNMMMMQDAIRRINDSIDTENKKVKNLHYVRNEILRLNVWNDDLSKAIKQLVGIDLSDKRSDSP